MPCVTVWLRAKGEPMASTHSPTSRLSLLPVRVNAGSESASMEMIAMSVFESAPTSVAG